MCIRDRDTTDLKYLAQVASSILGQDSYSQVFYTDGYYYVDANGVKLKYPMPLEQIISSCLLYTSRCV